MADKKIKLTLVKSVIGCKAAHRATVRGLRLKRINQTVELQDTPAVTVACLPCRRPLLGRVAEHPLFKNKDLKLVPGLFGRIRILGSDRYKGVLVPEEALAFPPTAMVLAPGSEQRVAPQARAASRSRASS